MIEIKKERFNTGELIKRFGNEKQKGYFERHGFISQKSERAILKTLIQNYRFVQKTKEGSRVYYIIGAKRVEEIERETERKTYDKSFYLNNVIYLVTNKINGKRYVGATSQTLSERMAKHKNSSFDEESKNYNTLIGSAIREYGWENFEWEVLEFVEDRADLNRVECYWIFYFESYKNEIGYNNYLGRYVEMGNENE